jgi:hypothetical protein
MRQMASLDSLACGIEHLQPCKAHSSPDQKIPILVMRVHAL